MQKQVIKFMTLYVTLSEKRTTKSMSMLMCFVHSAAQYFASTMMIVGMSVVVTVIVLQFHHHDPQGGKMPKWVSD